MEKEKMAQKPVKKARPAKPNAVNKAEPKPQTADKSDPKASKPEKAIILSYRRGRHTQRTRQMLVSIEGVDSKEKATPYIGRRVVWTTPAKREMVGKITHAHGRKGVMRARFQKGLPGEALGRKARVI